MELRHLRYFIAVAEAGSLTVAAEQRLHTSQPSLSRQIRNLEERVGAALLTRHPRGVELTDAGRAFLDEAKVAVRQIDRAVEAARRAARPVRQRFALGFLTGQEMTWLPETMRMLRDELPMVDVGISSDSSPDLAQAVADGRLDVAFLRAERDVDLVYRPVRREALVVLMPSDHRLARRKAIRPRNLVDAPFIGMDRNARVLRATIDRYLAEAGVAVAPAQTVDNVAMAMSLVASIRGLSIIPAYVENLMPSSVVSRPLAGKAPTIDLVVGYVATNPSPVLARFIDRIDELAANVEARGR